MTVFLWIVVTAMAASLLAELFALIGLLLVAKRTGRRVSEIKGQVMDRVSATTHELKELKLFIQPRVQALTQDGSEMKSLLASRLQSVQVAASDASRRVQRIHLRLNDGVQTVSQQGREMYREVVEPVQAAGQVIQGLRMALWFLRRVA